MLLVRAITESDFEGYLALAAMAGTGMTTLRADRQAQVRRIEIACASFAGTIDPPLRDYVFAMEDTETGRLAGICGIKGAVGLDEPFYNYRIGTLVHSSKEINVFSRMDTLYLSNDLTGCAELCSLFLHPDYRHGLNGKLLSKSRFMFIAQFPHLFTEHIIAEMRGYQDENGRSPFWDNLGRHFFKMEFDRADDLTALGQKSFIAELMPRHPLYVAYLAQEAQDVIGRVHSATEPARHLLQQEGLHYEGYIDIFDGGPVLQARVSELRAMRDSDLVTVEEAQGEGEFPPQLIATTAMQDFRVICAPVQVRKGRIGLTAEQQRALNCHAGDVVRAMPLNRKKGRHG